MNKFNIIVAFTKKSRGIGYKNTLPWNKIKLDLQRFKTLTKNNIIIMGRKTWDSIPNKPLKNRINIIISNTIIVEYPNTFVCKNIDDAFKIINDYVKNKEIYIIGGQQLYEQTITMSNCNKLYITEINQHYICDTYFPKIPVWMKMIKKEEHNNLCFKTYENKLDLMSEENQYLECLDKILKTGEAITDRTNIGTISLFNENLQFTINTCNPHEIDQNKLIYQIPAFTTKKIFFPGIIWELIWFLRGDTNVKWLQERNVHIWDGNSTKEFLEKRKLNYQSGNIGPGYGHQWIHWGGDWLNKSGGINQIEYVINELTNNPTSRRAIISAWNVSDLDKMALPPCHVLYIFKITDHNKEFKKLNCKVEIRSNDMFLGNPFNILSTSLLCILLSRAIGILPGKIAISITDAHIYKTHIEQVKKQLKRKPLEFPLLKINKKISNWHDMTTLSYNDFEINNYYCWPSIKAPMAI